MKPRLVTALVLISTLAACSNSTSSSTETNSPEISTSTIAGVANLLPCPGFKATTNIGTVKDTELDELSGLAKSSRNADILWTHNDSGDDARVFAIHTSGKVAGTYNLKGVNTFDAEDIAVSPVEPHDIWLADTGDNFHFRPSVQLYRFTEPTVTDGALADVDTQKINVKFQDPVKKGTMAVDSEAFFLDHAGNGYLVEKTKDTQKAWVFYLPADDLRKGGSITAQPIVQITGNSSGKGVGPTGADISADGTTLAIKNYSETLLWKFTADSSVRAVLEAQPTTSCALKAGLGEAITFDGSALLTVEEGTSKPIRKTEPK
jgi:hypothetical protein